MYNKLNKQGDSMCMTLSELIQIYRAKHDNMSQRKFANQCNLSNGYISMLEKGMNPNTGESITPTIPVLKKLANGMGLSLTDLFVKVDDIPVDLKNEFQFNSDTLNLTEDTVTFPVIGELAAGYDMFANEEYDTFDSIEIPLSYLKGRPKDDFFVLKIHGSSMYPMYMNNDKVLIKKTPTLSRSGDIGVVQYEDYATLKKVEYVDGEDWMKLIPINPSYEPKTISGAELEQCRIVGIPVLLIREIEQ